MAATPALRRAISDEGRRLLVGAVEATDNANDGLSDALWRMYEGGAGAEIEVDGIPAHLVAVCSASPELAEQLRTSRAARLPQGTSRHAAELLLRFCYRGTLGPQPPPAACVPELLQLATALRMPRLEADVRALHLGGRRAWRGAVDAAAVAATRSHPAVCDVELVGGDGARVAANRALLAARCEYFRALFQGPWSAGAGLEACVPELGGDGLAAIVDFVFSDDADLGSHEDIEGAVEAANFFGIDALRRLAAEQLADSVDARNVWEVLETAVRLELERATERCLALVWDDFAALSASPAFLQLSKRALLRVLGPGRVKAEFEVVSMAAWRWCRHATGSSSASSGESAGEEEVEEEEEEEEEQKQPDRRPRCAKCASAEGLSRCSACQRVWYCSVRCQRRDRRWHRPACREAALAVPRLTELAPDCVMCGAATRFTCSGCERQRYCSVACQRRHRRVHRPACERLPAAAGPLAAPRRPPAAERRARALMKELEPPKTLFNASNRARVLGMARGGLRGLL